jgi:hypothetical protein
MPLVACPHPAVCGVQYGHEPGSPAARNCATRISGTPTAAAIAAAAAGEPPDELPAELTEDEANVRHDIAEASISRAFGGAPLRGGRNPGARVAYAEHVVDHGEWAATVRLGEGAYIEVDEMVASDGLDGCQTVTTREWARGGGLSKVSYRYVAVGETVVIQPEPTDPDVRARLETRLAAALAATGDYAAARYGESYDEWEGSDYHEWGYDEPDEPLSHQKGRF